MKYTKLALSSVAIMMTSQMSNGATALLIDAWANADPSSYQAWVDAGVTEADATSAGGTTNSSGNKYNINGGIGFSMSGATGGGSGAFDTAPNDNAMVNDYAYVKEGTATFSLSGLDVESTSTLGDMNGNTFTLQTNQAYKLYLFGAGNADDQNTIFTFGGVDKTTSASIVGTAPNAGHFVTYNFTTPADITGYTVDFDYRNTGTTGNDIYGAFNGLAIVAVPEPSSMGLLGVATMGFLLRRRRG